MSNYCVCCGEEIPEGRMVCPSCEADEVKNGKIKFTVKDHNQFKGIKQTVVNCCKLSA